MTLQCFLNGSLAREKVKEQFDLTWDAFGIDAFEQTPPGNDGNLMLPFFGPEITPRLNLDAPVLNGDSDFVAGKKQYASVRACIEGQMINIWLHSRWMQLNTKEILLTGGASKNPGIAQTAADVFQATVKRLAVTGSVALGGAMRAAQAALGADLPELEATFCKTEDGLDLEPASSLASVYQDLARNFADTLAKAQ